MVEITSEEQNKVKRKELRIVSETSGTIANAPNLNYRGPRRREKKKGYEKIFEEIIAENFPNMEKELVNQVQEVQRVPYRTNPRRNIPRHVIIKLIKAKHKERILKTAREKQKVTYRGNPIHLTADLSAETPQARREWQDIFKVLKGKNLQPRLLYLAWFSLKIDGDIKSFSDKSKLREFSITKPALQQMLKGLTQSRNTREEKIYKSNPKQLRK